jgi:NADPH:quinone reductase-like Zn-dependent oxidoreductase
MQAVIHSAYGQPEQVPAVQEADKPVPKGHEVLVRVRAASLHPDVLRVGVSTRPVATTVWIKGRASSR